MNILLDHSVDSFRSDRFIPMLYDLIGVYSKVGQTGRHDDDVCDRYSHRWTVILLGIFILTISAKQFVGTPIECIPPSEFGGEHKTYVENHCWIHHTYSINEKTALTRDFVRGSDGSHRTPYYIWIPYIFLLAALSTYLPAWLWHVIGHRATFDIPAMINQLAKMNLNSNEDRQKNLLIIAKHYEKAERYSRVRDNIFKRLLSSCMFFSGGGLLTGIYFVMKLFYLINAIGQFFLMNYLLQINYWSYGQNVLSGMIRGGDWLENKIIFPRIVFCDFTIRYLGDNNPNYTVQCTLPVNLYNERIFAFYWFWLVFLVCATSYGIVVWLFQMSYRARRSFLKRHLRLNLNRTNFTEEHRQLFNVFIDRYLGGDGIFFLQLISKNTNPVVAGELLTLMWQRFIPRENTIQIFDCDTYLNARPTTMKVE